MIRTIAVQSVLAALLALGVLATPSPGQNGRPGPQRPQSHSPSGAATAAEQPNGANDRQQVPSVAGPSSTGPQRTRVPKEGKVVLAFNDVAVEETIPFIVESTGKVVMPVNLGSLKTKKITLMNDEPIDRAAALDLLVTALRLNGVGVVETRDLVVLDLLENIKTKYLPVLTAQDDVMGRPDRGQFIIKIYRLTQASAENVGERLQDNLPDYATLSIDPNSNQIILYGDVGLAQNMQLLIDQLDHNHIVIRTETFRLAYADAQSVADQIDELFADTIDPTQGGGGGGAGRRATRPARNPPAGTGGGGTPAGPAGPGPVVELRISVNVQQNAVTVSAEPAKIDAIARLVAEEWDLPRPEETAKVYVLEHTDPLKVRDLLQDLLGGGSGSRSGGGAARGGRAQQAGGAGGGAQGGASIAQAIGDIYRIEAYPDQNSIVVLSKTKDALAYLDFIVESIDQPSTVGLPQVVELKHASAISLANELNVLLAEAGSGGSLEGPDEGLTGEGIGGIADDGGDRGGGTADSGAGGRGAGTIEFPWQRGRPRDDQSEPSSLIGKVRIVPIVRQNALAILAPIAQRHAVTQLIRDFDKPGRQVMISAVIAEVELTDDFAFGLRFSSEELVSSLSDNSFRGSVGFEGTQEDIFGSLFDTSVLDVNADINVLLQAIRQKTNVRILQEPRVFTADNQEAIFFDGQDVPFITESNTTDIGGITQSFDYQEVGVSLDVRPRITAQRDVDMEINLELSSIVPGETLFGGFILDRRETTTKVIVKNGQTIVLSGILTDSESQITRGLPILSELPLIGDLFKSHENNKITTELIAFITPIVVDNPDENDENFNERARERLQELGQPLKEQFKNRKGVREQILGPKGEERYEPVFPTRDIVQPAGEPSGDPEEDKDKDPVDDPRNRNALPPRNDVPIDVDDLDDEPGS